MLKKLLGVALFFCLALCGTAHAQGWYCYVQTPRAISATSYLLNTQTDPCAALNFTASAPVALYLPPAATVQAGAPFQIFVSGAGGVTMTPSPGQTVAGLSTLLVPQYRSAVIMSDGSNYQVIGGTVQLSLGAAQVGEGGTGGTSASAARTGLGLGTAATVNTGTSGATLGELNANKTDSGTNTYSGALNTFTGHIAAGTNAPGLTGCGSGSPAIIGDDKDGQVTMGTNATGCVITFHTAYVSPPLCTVTWQATPLASQSWTVSDLALTLTQTETSGNVANYHCAAQNGG